MLQRQALEGTSRGAKVKADLHVWARILPGLGVQEGGWEHRWRLHLVLSQHSRKLGHVPHPHVEGGAQVWHVGDGALHKCIHQIPL